MKLRFGLNVPSLCTACIHLDCTDFGIYECQKSGMVFYGYPRVTGCNNYIPDKLKLTREVGS